LEGKDLDLLSWLHRNGTLHLTLVLPDGTRSYIPADWTNLGDICPQKFKSTSNREPTDLIASRSNLLQVRKIVDALLLKIYPPKQKSKIVLKEGHNHAKAIGTLARSRGAENSRNLEQPESSTEEKNHNRSITSCQQVRLPKRNKSNQGDGT
jgi:hypothetical protein